MNGKVYVLTVTKDAGGHRPDQRELRLAFASEAAAKNHVKDNPLQWAWWTVEPVDLVAEKHIGAFY